MRSNDQQIPLGDPNHTYEIPRGRRVGVVFSTAICLLWLLISAFLWFSGEAEWFYFIAALGFMVTNLISAYYAFASRLVLSSLGIHLYEYGATYFAPWPTMKALRRRRLLWRDILEVTLSDPIKPTRSGLMSYVIGPRPISSIELQDFANFAYQLPVEIAQYAPQLLTPDQNNIE